MALNDAPGSEIGSDPEDLEALEREAKEMAQKILQYRATLPDQLKNTFASALAAQRPILPDGSDPGTSGAPNLDAGQVVSNRDTLLADKDQTTEKVRLLKDKVSRNLAALPVVMKRMKECISKIEKLDARNRIIHPAFQRKKTSYP